MRHLPNAALGWSLAGLVAVDAPASAEILIGGAICLTGLQAPLDEPGFKGAQVAVKQINDAGGLLGQPVRFLNIDGKSDPVTVGNAAVELIDQGAQLIVAPCDFDFGGPASREAQAAGIVGISMCASDPLYSSWSLGDKQFTLSMWNTTMGATAADYAFTERGWKTAYVVTDQFIAYTKSLSKYFIEHFKTLGGEVLLEDTYTNGDNDFSAQLARLQALGQRPDVIFISSYGTDIATIIRSIREVGIDSPVLGGDSYDDAAIHEALGERFGSEIYFVTHSWMGPEAHPDMPAFIEAYTEMYGEPPGTAFVATGYDTVMLMAKAVEIAGSTDGDAVAQALTSNEFDLLTGKLALPLRRGGSHARQGGGARRARPGQAPLHRLAHAREPAAALSRSGQGRCRVGIALPPLSLRSSADARVRPRSRRRLGRVRRPARARSGVAAPRARRDPGPDRPQRVGQDDAGQRPDRAARAGRGAACCATARTSPGCRRTGSPGAASPARFRSCGCSAI